MTESISAGEMEALRSLAAAVKRQSSVSPEIERSLLAKGLIERHVAFWVVTSRGHAAILRADMAKRTDLKRGD